MKVEKACSYIFKSVGFGMRLHSYLRNNVNTEHDILK